MNLCTRKIIYYVDIVDLCLVIQLLLLIIGVKHSLQQSADDTFPVIYLEGYRNLESREWIKVTDISPEEYNELLLQGDDDFSVINSKIVSDIVVTCKSNVPIYWVMTDVQPTTLSASDMYTATKVVYEDGTDFSTIKEFQSLLQLNNRPILTGLYTCQSYKEEKLRKSVYLFLTGNAGSDERILVEPPLELTVGVNGQEEVVVPCKVTKKDANVTLFTKQNDGEDWVSTESNFSFDPKKGFIINSSKVGTYKCTAGSDEKVIVNVVEEYALPEKKFPIFNELEGTARWAQRKHGDGIECCSNSTTAPDLFVVACENMPHCEMTKKAFLNYPKITTQTYGIMSTTLKEPGEPCIRTAGYIFVQPFLIQCVGDGVNVSGEYVMDFVPPKNTNLRYEPVTQNGSFPYSVDTAIRIRYLKWINETKGDESSLSFVQVTAKDRLYHGERFVFDCCGIHFPHAIGRIQRIGWKNGTVQIMETPEKDKESWSPVEKDFCYSYRIDPEEEDYLVTADVNMSYFECIVPLWYDTKPTVIRLDLEVKVPKEPVLVSQESDSQIQYDENQVGLLRLDCDLSQGDPVPRMTWTKDGYKVNQTDIYWSIIHDKNPDHPGTVLLFMRAVKEIQGEFECFLENQMGTAQKTFTVKVKPRSYVDYWVALAIFGGFFALIICCALRIASNEKQISSKQVEPLP
ncbi:unnamed protein product [Orchesella dallaii]|uniref:Ig-like domain-containing protein n=1 Tax=Orchesella dallaii TaxID=48710 RepID=A0ABP1QX74_9HEXA